MSLNRAVAALGAVAVVGALTVGFSVYQANDAGKRVPKVYVTAGSTWTPLSPVCYNDGKVLSTPQLKVCVAKVQKLGTNASAQAVSAHPNTTFTIGVDKAITEKSWNASIGATTLVPTTKKFQANNLPLSSVFTTSTDQTTGATTTADKGTVLVVEGKGDAGDIYGVWLFTLKSAS